MAFTKIALQLLSNNDRGKATAKSFYLRETGKVLKNRKDNGREWKMEEQKEFISAEPFAKKIKLLNKEIKESQANSEEKKALMNRLKAAKEKEQIVPFVEQRKMQKFAKHFLHNETVYRCKKQALKKYQDNPNQDFDPKDGRPVIPAENCFKLFTDTILNDSTIPDNQNLKGSVFQKSLNATLGQKYYAVTLELVTKYIDSCALAFERHLTETQDSESDDSTDDDHDKSDDETESSSSNKSVKKGEESVSRSEKTWTSPRRGSNKTKNKNSNHNTSDNDNDFVNVPPKTLKEAAEMRKAATKKKSKAKEKADIAKNGNRKKKASAVSDTSETTKATKSPSPSPNDDIESSMSKATKEQKGQDLPRKDNENEITHSDESKDNENEITHSDESNTKNSDLKVDDKKTSNNLSIAFEQESDIDGKQISESNEKDETVDVPVNNKVFNESDMDETSKSTKPSPKKGDTNINNGMDSSKCNSDANNKSQKTNNGERANDDDDKKEAGKEDVGKDTNDGENNDPTSKNVTTETTDDPDTYLQSLGRNLPFHSILLHVFCETMSCDVPTLSDTSKKSRHNQFVLMVMDLATGFCWFYDIGNKKSFIYLVMERLNSLFGAEGYPHSVSYLNCALGFNEDRYKTMENGDIKFDHRTNYGDTYSKEMKFTSNQFLVGVSNLLLISLKIRNHL